MPDTQLPRARTTPESRAIIQAAEKIVAVLVLAVEQMMTLNEKVALLAENNGRTADALEELAEIERERDKNTREEEF